MRTAATRTTTAATPTTTTPTPYCNGAVCKEALHQTATGPSSAGAWQSLERQDNSADAWALSSLCRPCTRTLDIMAYFDLLPPPLLQSGVVEQGPLVHGAGLVLQARPANSSRGLFGNYCPILERGERSEK